MSETPQPVDVGALLAALRQEVRARRMGAGQHEPDGLERDIQRSLDEIELTRVVSAHWPLISHSLPQRGVNLVNKVVRRLLRWYINPIVEQQNAYNDAVARSLRLLAEAYGDLTRQLAETSRAATPGPNDTPPPTISTAAELQQYADAQAEREPAPPMPDLELQHTLPHLRLREQVSAHWHLGGTSRPEQVAALVHKTERQYLRWLINPIVAQQNAANGAISTAIHQLARLDAARRAAVAAKRAERR